MTSSTSLNARLRQTRDRFDGLGLLAMRVWLAQEFGVAAWMKLSGGLHAPEWFASLGFPFFLAWMPADANWTLAGLTELIGALALLLGWGSRLAALALIFVCYVAVYTVHFDLGWAGWRLIDTEAGQGFKVPLMMAVMLLVLLTQGAGRLSLDQGFQPDKT